MNYIKLSIWLLGLSILTNCTPDCDDTQYQVDINTVVGGEQFLIKNSQIKSNSIDLVFLNGQLEKRTTAEFNPSLNGFLARAESDLNGMTQVLVDDPDCGLLLITDDVNVVNISNNYTVQNFVIPQPLDLVVPLPVAFPPTDLIANAWVSPNDFEYCIWFNFYGSDGRELPAPTSQALIDSLRLSPDTITVSKKLNPFRSNELNTAVAFCGRDLATTLNHGNPVSGIVDAENNIIQFTIDRTSKGMGTESFRGEFVDPRSYPQPLTNYARFEGCETSDTWWDEGAKMMLVTSEQTGRQLLLYQNIK